MIRVNEIIKKVIKHNGLGPLLRKIRYVTYIIFDFMGTIVFSVFKILKIISEDNKFEKKLIKKILVIRIDRIGDLILSTPVFRSLKQTYAEAQVHVLVREYTKDLIINNKNVDKIMVLEKAIIDQDYDLAIVLNSGITANRFAFMSKAKFRIGYEGRGGSFLLTKKIKDDRDTRIRHEVVSALELAGITDCTTDDKTLEVSVTAQGEKIADEFFTINNLSSTDFLVMIHPGARQDYIRWNTLGFAEVADMLIQKKSAKVILLCGKEEDRLVEEVNNFMNNEAIIASNISLTGLVSLIKRVKLFIGNSTGPMHIASALGTPLVAIFGSRHPLDSVEEWGPWGENNCVVRADVNCINCHPSDCRDDFKCMSKISPDQVLRAVNSLSL